MRTKFAAVAFALVAGCATQQPAYWFHPTIGQNAATREADVKIFERDKAQCDYESTASTQTTDYSYRTIFGQELDRANRRTELRTLCMKARGYTWRTAQPGDVRYQQQQSANVREANP